MRLMETGLALASGALLLVTGCADAGGEETAADCGLQVRFNEVVYTGWSTTTRDAAPLGQAERASCDDTSEDAAGSFFDDDPESVRVWSFDGLSPEDVLGVRFDEDSFTIFVADSLSDQARERLLADLHPSTP